MAYCHSQRLISSFKPHQRSFFLKSMVINTESRSWTVDREEETLACSALNGLSSSIPPHKAQGYKWEKRKIVRAAILKKKQHHPGTREPMCICNSQRLLVYIHKTHTSSSQAKSQCGRVGPKSHIWPKSSLQIIGFFFLPLSHALTP